MVHDTATIMPAPLDPALLGHATVTPEGAFAAGSMQSFELVYTAGFYGIDDSGSIRIVGRFASDQSQPQLDDPKGWNYTTVEASNGAVLRVRFDSKGNVRPWDRTLEIRVVRGYLEAGDTIIVRFGDRREGSPGMRLQTFAEESFEFRVLVDPVATYVFQPLPEQPTIAIVPGEPHEWRLVLPTLRRAGQPFRLGIKADDVWGNPTDRAQATLRLEASSAIGGLPDEVEIAPGRFATTLEGLVATGVGDLVVRAFVDGREVARSNPLRIVAEDEYPSFWGDLHGQSEETIGTNSARDYFLFARDRAFLDACAHQGNDFQMSRAFWNELNALTAELDEPGRFVTLPGYEWSGNTALGGDRNVYFATEGRPMRRSSHAMIPEDRRGPHDVDLDCGTAAELFAALRAAGEDAVCFAHCGGRYADIKLAHDGVLERSVEVHSAWGTFEWLLHDALEAGHRVGVVCNSDGHKGRPGASYAGAAAFGAIGGLTCYRMPELTREALFACLRRRHHYGTSGARLHLSMLARSDGEMELFDDDPALGPALARPVERATMGDIVRCNGARLELEVEVSAGAPIERIDVFDGKSLIATRRPYGEGDLGRRIRVIWEGAEYRGRARQVIWDGRAVLDGNRIERATPINFFNRDKVLEREGGHDLRWRHLTTGNFGGFDLHAADAYAGRLHIETPLIQAEVPLSEIGLEERVFDASGDLPRLLRLFRLPDDNPHRAMHLRLPVELAADRDAALYVRVTTEDGHRAWSSPTYVVGRGSFSGRGRPGGGS
ncbi:MAG: hypothetical protein KDE35_10825 [Geminicoccaceae bacterium]|nr:hypothetical protein [Geminicoccaceae bacterium]